MLHDQEIAAIEAEVKAEIDDAVAFAEAGRWEPGRAELTRDVYAGSRRHDRDDLSRIAMLRIGIRRRA